jgi:CPA2 family monovalent cation:H+ antiporter-2
MHPAMFHFALAVALLALGALVAFATQVPALPLYLFVGVLAAAWLNVELLQPLPDLGLLLLLFSIGVEFGPERLAAISWRAIRAGLWDALALPAGLGLGLALGLDWRAALLLGGVVYISSSAVITRLIIDLQRAAYPESDVVLSVLVFEDLVIAAVLALTAGRTGVPALLASLGLVAAYLLTAHVLGPRLRPRLERLPSEVLLLLGAAFTVGTAELFHAVGASEGIGAFLAGTVVTGIGLRERLEALFAPVRDLAAALFFLAVGATAASTLRGVGTDAVVLALGALLLKLPLNYRSGAAGGLGVRGRLLTMLSLIPRGEFTLVLGTIALQDGLTLVGQTAVLLVLLSVPLGALVIQAGPRLTRTLRGRRPPRAVHPRPPHPGQGPPPVVPQPEFENDTHI